MAPVPQALICALEAADYEDAVRNAISLDGDADALACIAGGIAEALDGFAEAIRSRLDRDLLSAVERFDARIAAQGGSTV